MKKFLIFFLLLTIIISFIFIKNLTNEKKNQANKIEKDNKEENYSSNIINGVNYF